MEKGMKSGLTAAEVSQLWGTYMSDSSQLCVLSYFLEVVEDRDIKNVIQHACNSANSHIETIANLFSKEGRVVPQGFKLTQDVEVSVSKIYTDNFMLEYVHEFCRIGLRGHATSLSVAVRKDCTEFFKECLTETVKLYELAKDLLVTKGLYIRSAHLQNEKEVDYIHHQSFLSGFFGDKRALTAPEITNLYANFQRNALGAATLIGFRQIAKSNEVSQYFTRGKEIAEKHCEILGSYLKKNDLPASLYWDSEVIENHTPIFSDKLMMFIASSLSGVGTSFYGLGLGSSLRRDLGAMYNRFLAEVQLYAEDGTNIMIKNGWLESPPKVREN